MKKYSNHQIDKAIYESSLIEYVKYSFKCKTKKDFILNWHHEVICDALEKVFKGEIQNLIINMPPRYSKTEIAVKNFVEWCLAKVPSSKFIHLSYSDMLALDNSSEIREDIKSDWYQKFWPMQTKKDSDAKQRWDTNLGGGMYATGTMGSITGFGAGKLEETNDGEKIPFGGAILIDDPLKPEEAYSETQRKKANERLNNTILSRRNSNKTPIIIIMQRLHEDDMTGFCLAGNTSEKWHHLSLPVIDKDDEPLWELKHNKEQIEALRKADRRTFSGQYMQQPAPEEGALFKRHWFKFYTDLPERFHQKIQSWDFAVKDKATSDFTVGGAFGRIGADKYMLDMVRAKMDFPTACQAVVSFSRRHPDIGKKLVEDKANGSPVLDTLKHQVPGMVPVVPINDKVFRANAVLPTVEAGNFYLPHPSICPWVNDVIEELCFFPYGTHDDIVDVVVQALNELNKASIVYSPIAGHGKQHH